VQRSQESLGEQVEKLRKECEGLSDELGMSNTERGKASMEIAQVNNMSFKYHVFTTTMLAADGNPNVSIPLFVPHLLY